MNIDILGNSELKWTGMGKFNLDDHYIYYCGKEPLRRNEVALTVNKRLQNAGLFCHFKNNTMISVCSQDKPFNIIVIQTYASITDTERAEVNYFMLQGLKFNNSVKTYNRIHMYTHTDKVLFFIGDWNAQVGSQGIPRITNLALEYIMKQDKG